MQRKHTPGPWKKDDDGFIVDSNDKFVCDYAGCGTHAVEWKNSADYTLALAAPELLEALQFTLKYAEDWIHDQLDGTGGLNDALRELDGVRAIIRKATGEAADGNA